MKIKTKRMRAQLKQAEEMFTKFKENLGLYDPEHIKEAERKQETYRSVT